MCVFSRDCELSLLLGSYNGMGANNPQNMRLNKLVRNELQIKKPEEPHHACAAQ